MGAELYNNILLQYDLAIATDITARLLHDAVRVEFDRFDLEELLRFVGI